MPPSRLATRVLATTALALACAGSAKDRAKDQTPADPRAAALAEDGLALVRWDDAASLDRAAELFQAALRADPKLHQARAHQALVELLLAAARRDEAARLASPEGDALRQGARDLRERALDELRPLARDAPQDPAVVRALAVYYGLDGNAPQTARLAAQARARGSDPWIDFAELAADLRDGASAESAARLTAFAASHPGLLRVRMMLARAQLERSGPEEALRTLDEILAANPRHEQALELKARILAPPPARVAAAPPSDGAPPPQKPGYLPRKRNGAAPAAPVTREPSAPALGR